MKRDKIVKSEGIKLPDGEIMNQVGQEGYTYLGIIELVKIKETEMKEKITKEYKRRQSLILKSKLNGRNKVTAINTWAVAIFRYGAGITQWKAGELNDLDRKSRKTMTMYGRLHPKSDVDRLYVKRKEGGRDLISVERCIREEENSLRFYVANSDENLIRGVLTAETINTRETISSLEFKKQREKELKEKWSECTDNSSGKQQKKLIKLIIVAKVIKRGFKGWNRSIAVCCTGTGNQDKLYKLPHR